MNKNNDIYNMLTEKEKQTIEKLNNTSNTIRQLNEYRKNPINMSIEEVFHQWSKENMIVFTEVVHFFSNLETYSKYFNNIDDTGKWFKGIKIIISDLIQIMMKNNRPIYIGITLLLLSFGLYIIQITS